MSVLVAYRDDGPLARWIGATLGRVVPAGELPLTLLAVVVLGVALAVSGSSLDDALVTAAAAAAVLLGGAAAGRRHTGRMAWLVPPLLRVLEYAFLIRLTVVADGDAMPLCFAFLGVLAFHHYDIVYRLRHQKLAPPAWISAVGGGWEGRLLLASVLAVAGALGPGLLVAAVGLAIVYATESVLSWARFARAERRPVTYEDDDDEDVQDA
jgi:hypothetical protein